MTSTLLSPFPGPKEAPPPVPVHGFGLHVPEPHLEPRVEVLAVELQRGHVTPAAQLGEGGTGRCGGKAGHGPAPHPQRRQPARVPPFTSRVLMRGTGVTGSRVHARLVLKENSTDSVPMMVQQELSLSSALFASLGQGDA